MNRLLVFLGGVPVLGVYFFVAPAVVASYRLYRKRRTVICPETDQIAEVEVKAGRAALMSGLGKRSVRVKGAAYGRVRRVAQKNA